MKSLITIAIVLISLTASAQTKVQHIKQSYLHVHEMTDTVIVLGCADKFTGKVKDGLFKSRISQQSNELAIVSGYDHMLTYYKIYNEAGKLIADGKLSKNEGEYAIIKMGVHFPKSYCLMLSSN